MSYKIKDFINLLDKYAPLDTQMDWDNSGMMIGHMNKEITGVYFSMDIHDGAIKSAIEKGANTILTHHPLFFESIRSIDVSKAHGRHIEKILKNDLAVISFHTNLDVAEKGVNTALAEAMGFESNAIEGFLGRDTKIKEMFAYELLDRTREGLRTNPIFIGDINKKIERILFLGGSGGDFIDYAINEGYDAFITSEIKHHQAIAAREEDIFIIDGGHYETEYPVLPFFGKILAKELPVEIFWEIFHPPIRRI